MLDELRRISNEDKVGILQLYKALLSSKESKEGCLYLTQE